VSSHYIIALGSNRRHPRHGAPAHVLAAAMAQLDPVARSRIITSRPIGPSQRAYANAAILIESDLLPPAMLTRLKAIERDFGRRVGGQRWAARVLDLDIILWSGGIWADQTLIIPHLAYGQRAFVLGPLCEIAAHWRDPLTHFSPPQQKARLDRTRARV
jgi:2-amino-4-hydroxy-6-hydroxymethyldihydropteridine diphosphokinase